MEKSQNRYELIIGFVTLIISFSAFKDELGQVEVNLGFIQFTLASYLLYVVYGFGLCIYLYIIERISRQSKRLNSWKIVDYVEKIAFLFFVFIVISPLILSLISLVFFGFDKYTKLDPKPKEFIIGAFTTILGLISGILATLTTRKYFDSKNKSRQDEIEKEEITELENAVKLYESNFYSQAILEAFKVLEIHLIKLLSRKNINIPRHQFSFIELFNYSKN